MPTRDAVGDRGGRSGAARRSNRRSRSPSAASLRSTQANPELNAFVHLDAPARSPRPPRIDAQVAAGEDPGPLAGVPFGVKDLDDCAGMPTTNGSRWYLGLPPVAHDALHVARLRAAGAIPLGKTAAPEFGTFAYTASPALGVTRNPWNPERTPGGSSGGSAAAVSAGMVPFATVERRRRLDPHARRASAGSSGSKCSYGRIPDAIAGRYGADRGARRAHHDGRRQRAPARRDGRARTAATAARCPRRPCSYEDAIESLDVDGAAHRVVERSRLRRRRSRGRRRSPAAAFDALAAAGYLAVDARTIEFADPIPVWAKIERRRHVGAHPRRLLARTRRRARPAGAPGIRRRGEGHAAEVRRGAAGAARDRGRDGRPLRLGRRARHADGRDPRVRRRGPDAHRDHRPTRARRDVGAVRDAVERLGLARDLGAGRRHGRAVCRWGCSSWPTVTATTCACASPACSSRRSPWPRHAPR